MTDPTSQLSINRQAPVLGVSRRSVYYLPRPISTADLKLMHRIDNLHLGAPFAGSRMLQGLLVQERFKVGRLYAVTLKRLTVIRASHRVSPTQNLALTLWLKEGFLLDMGPERL